MRKYIILVWLLSLSGIVIAQEKPNVVFILADDLGINALNCYGNKLVESPNIDKLFSEGMHFTNGYSNDPTCAPSRASIMTGQYVPRHKVYRVTDRHEQDPVTLANMKYLPPEINRVAGQGKGLSPEKITIAEAFKANGYATAGFGKWHLGTNQLDMIYQGFDEAVQLTGHYDFKTSISQSDVNEKEYSSDYVTRKGVDFIRKQTNDQHPFFLYLPYYLVHKPLEPKREHLQYFKEIHADNPNIGSDEIKVLAMIKSLDESVGQVLDAIAELGIEDNTIIIFASDNGHYKTESNLFTQPFRGVKGETYEGRIRVPYIFKWPGKIQEGSKSTQPIIHVDIYPTLLGLTSSNATYQIMDGEDISPILLGKTNNTERDALIWEYTNYARYNSKSQTFASSWVNVIQMDGYKLTEMVETGGRYMYNLENDPYETKDIFSEEKEVANRLIQRLEKWKVDVGYEGPVENPVYRSK